MIFFSTSFALQLVPQSWFSGLILRVGEFANVKATNNKAQLNLYFSEHKVELCSVKVKVSHNSSPRWNTHRIGMWFCRTLG